MQTRLWTIFTRQGKEVTAQAWPQALAGVDEMIAQQADCMVLLVWCGSARTDWLEIKLLKATEVSPALWAMARGESIGPWYRRDHDPAQEATLCQLIGPLSALQVNALQQQIGELQALRGKLAVLDQELMQHGCTILTGGGDVGLPLTDH